MPDVRPEGSGQRPRRSGSLEAIRAAAWLGVTYRGKVVSRGRAAPPRHRVPVPGTGRTATPGGRLVFHVLAALAELIRGLIAEGFALSGAATGQHGQAVALLAWLCRAPGAQVCGSRPAPGWLWRFCLAPLWRLDAAPGDGGFAVMWRFEVAPPCSVLMTRDA